MFVAKKQVVSELPCRKKETEREKNVEGIVEGGIWHGLNVSRNRNVLKTAEADGDVVLRVVSRSEK